MKTIEERAIEYAPERQYDSDITLPDYEISDIKREAFISGAKSEHDELTRWNDPKVELPEDDRYSLLKLRVAYSTKIRYAVGYFRHDKQQWIGFALGYDEIIGWREIQE